MSTTAPLAAVPDSPTSAVPTVELTLPVEINRRGRKTTEVRTFTAEARGEGSSMMKIASGQNVYAGLQALLVARLLDDDGISYQALPRLIAESDLTWPDDAERAPDGPAVVPDDATLKKARHSELVGLCETHDLDTEGTKADLVKALTNKRAADAGADLAVPDDELVDDAQQWRLVWPDDTTGLPTTDPVLDENGDDYGAFDSLDELRKFAKTNGSSLRRFIASMDDPLETCDDADIDRMAQQIVEGAARRPTRPSQGSRSSRRGRGRSAR